MYSFIGESLEATGDLPAAARWFTVGLTHAIRDFGEDSYEAEDLLVGRRRARQAQALPQDEYDEMAEEALAERSVSRTDDGRVLAGVLHWPPGEFAQLAARFPDLATDCDVAADGHRAQTEHALRRYTSQGLDAFPVFGSLQVRNLL